MFLNLSKMFNAWESHVTSKKYKILTDKGFILNFQWILGHKNIPGNEKADALAKLMQTLSKTKELLTSFGIINNEIALKILKKWKINEKTPFLTIPHISHSTRHPDNAI